MNNFLFNDLMQSFTKRHKNYWYFVVVVVVHVFYTINTNDTLIVCQSIGLLVRHIEKFEEHIPRALALRVKQELVITAVRADGDHRVWFRAEGTNTMSADRHLETRETPL